MAEEKGNKANDVVSAESYNKAIENANSLKVDKEKAEKELKEIKEKNEKEIKTKEEADKKSWEKEKVEKDKIIKELKEKAEGKVSKGVVKEPKKVETTPEKIKEMLDKEIPDSKFDPKKVGSNIQRYGHYKNPTTKEFTNEQLGMALDLNRGAASLNPDHIPNEARASNKDIIFNK